MYKDIVKPTLVLIIIVGVMSALLAFTYNFAGIKDLGVGIPKDELDAMMETVLPGATGLKNVDITVENPDVLGCYVDEGGAGSAIFLQTKGYASDPIKIMVGIKKDGTVAGIKIVSTAETPGLGTKIEEPNYIEQYIGKTGKLETDKNGGDISVIAGATYSSNGLLDGVNTALEVYESVKGEL